MTPPATPRWSSRSLGSALQHRIFYALIRLAGVRAAYALLVFVVSWYTLRPAVRQRSAAYIARRFPKTGRAAGILHTWNLQWRFGQCLVDRAAAGILGGFSFEPLARVVRDQLPDRGMGLIMLTAHTGCWQMAPYALAEHDSASVAVLGHKGPGDIDKDVHEHGNTPLPFARISGDGGLGVSVALLALLRRGGIICMMGDRVMDAAEPAVAVSFYGSPVMVPAIAYRLASASGAPLVCAFALRTGSCRGRLCVADVIHVPPGIGRTPGSAAVYAQRYADALERFTRENPYQFFNFYNLWE